jgi:hypothetical protein
LIDAAGNLLVFGQAGCRLMNLNKEQAVSCVVCAAPLARIDQFRSGRDAPADPYPTCFAIACRMVVSRRADMDDAGFRHYLQRQAKQTRERQELNRLLNARRLREEPENTQAWKGMAARLPGSAAEPIHLLLPSGPRRARKMSARRRARYQAHLEDIVAAASLLAPAPDTAAFASEEKPTVAPPPSPDRPSTMPGRLCGICAGGCCTLGAEHAYLTPAGMRALMDKDVALTGKAIVAAYLDHLPGRSQAGSCINHTRGGCALPREMRSATCNRYACKSLATLLQAQRERSGVDTVIVIQRRLHHWRRLDTIEVNPLIGGAVLTEQGVRRVPLRGPDLSTGEQPSRKPFIAEEATGDACPAAPSSIPS